jgi:hypothetical protein
MFSPIFKFVLTFAAFAFMAWVLLTPFLYGFGQ